MTSSRRARSARNAHSAHGAHRPHGAHRARRAVPLVTAALVLAAALGAPRTPAAARAATAAAPSAAAPAPARAAGIADRIDHVVILFQENHSFDNVLGLLCRTRKCDGATSGQLPTGERIALRRATDLVPDVDHSDKAHATAINGGKMNGFGRIRGCTPADGYACYSQFTPDQIPNLARLSRSFAISDRTFELDPIGSWGAHLELVTSHLNGFTGAFPRLVPGNPKGPGWGCNSYKDADWSPRPGATPFRVPACIPKPDGSGPYRASPVQWTPTIMERLDDAGLPWRLYSGRKPEDNGAWAICPTFAACLYTPRVRNVVPAPDILTDARAGRLPAFSVALPWKGPSGNTSQHNHFSMLVGDNWIGKVVSAIQQGPDWASTAVFITYDDCGCFYDHVPPPPGLGIRVPMTIVSPYARRGYVDSRVASFDSLLALTERAFGLPPLTAADRDAYDFADSFDFAQAPLPPVPLVQTPPSRATLDYIARHEPDPSELQN